MTTSVPQPAGAQLDPMIRFADEGDLDAIRDLDAQARIEIEGHKGAQAWLAEHPEVSVVFGSPGSRILVAELGGAVVGFLVSIDRHDPLRGSICSVERVYVDARTREVGCGDSLLAAAVANATDRGCDFLEGESLPGDRETKNLYERAVITARKIIVSKRLSDPSTGEPSFR